MQASTDNIICQVCVVAWRKWSGTGFCTVKPAVCLHSYSEVGNSTSENALFVSHYYLPRDWSLAILIKKKYIEQ